jgi:glycosyltransferase involved in cell wall biosynthesis
MPKLSIIICTYNREKYLYDALKSIAENDFSVEKYEIVLVNNNSTDRTEAECERFQHDFPQVNFRYFVEKNQGLSYARNKGIEESTGEMLIFLDDDAFVGKNYLENLTEYLSLHPEMSAFGGKITPVFESGKTPAWLSVWSNSFVSALDKGKSVKEFTSASYPIGANMGFYKKCLEKTGNFNVELGRKKKNLAGGEEKDLFNRFKENGFRIFYLPDIEVSHIIPENRTTYDYIQKLGLGVGASEYVRCAKQEKLKLFIRYVSELIKWGITLILYLYYALLGQSPKGFALILFRKSVSKGLFLAKD